MTRPGEQNEIDLGRIVDEINAVFAQSGVDFVFIPGDIADDGSVLAYETVRRHLDRLEIPWCGIVGDHDVHERSFDNFRTYIAPDLFGSFSIGPYRFLRLNAFSTPRPDAFSLGEEQLQWLEQELESCQMAADRAVLFLHCYPSDLKQGGAELKRLLRKYPVLLVDMGHTHYNELSNDGHTLYSATRSTGQIEEGPVGYSVTTIDDDTVSWHFVEVGCPELVVITQPPDERLLTESNKAVLERMVPVRVKTWGPKPIHSVRVQSGDSEATLSCPNGLMWEGSLDLNGASKETRELKAIAVSEGGLERRCSIRVRVGPMPQRSFAEIDQENAIGEWSERGLLGTQLGPNKNGKKW